MYLVGRIEVSEKNEKTRTTVVVMDEDEKATKAIPMSLYALRDQGYTIIGTVTNRKNDSYLLLERKE